VRRLILLHEREGQDLLDGVVVRQEHDQTVDAHTPSTGGRQTVLQAGAEVLVDELGLVVALGLLAGLLLEAEALVEGVVELGVRVDDLLLAHKGLEALAETRVLAVVLGQRGHHLRVARDEGRVDARLLDEFADEFVQHAGVGHGWRALDVVLRQELLEELVRLLRVELVARRELLARGLLEGRDHLDPAPGRLPVDGVHLAGLGVEGRLVAAGDVLDQTGDELLSQVHDVVDVRVGPVELAGGELRVVGEVDALVAELAAQLVHALQTADDEHLEVQLGRDTHVQVHVELVVVRDERLGRRTAGDGVHHGRLDLDEVAAVEEAANVADDLVACDEDVARLVVHDQVEVALAVALLLVTQTVVLRGDGVQAWRQKDNLPGEDGELSLRSVLGVAATWETDDTDDISSPQVLVLGLEGHVTRGVLGLADNLDLDPLRADVVEYQLRTRSALGVYPSRDAHSHVGLLLALGEALVVLEVLPEVIGDLELVRVRVWVLGLAQLVDTSTADLEVLL